MKNYTKKSSLDKILDIWYSRYIRLRDSDGEFGACCSCVFVDNINNLDNGHFISRTKKATKYDERNTNLQCKRCNSYLKGNLIDYAIFLENKYGYGIVQELKEKSKKLCKLGDDFYEKNIQYYKRECKKLDVKNIFNYKIKY